MARALDEYEHPQSPIRDDSKLGATEDLDREPDGFPHGMYIATALSSIMLGILVLAVWTRRELDAMTLVLLGIPLLIVGLAGRAERDRDHVHPSR